MLAMLLSAGAGGAVINAAAAYAHTLTFAHCFSCILGAQPGEQQRGQVVH